MIRELDINKVAEIWLDTNIKTLFYLCSILEKVILS